MTSFPAALSPSSSSSPARGGIAAAAIRRLTALTPLDDADLRLLAMLRWISVRFGQVNSHGHRLSLKEMNLTHRDLADLCGLTRVTVTKNLNRFKTLGLLRGVGDSDWLIPADARVPGLTES